MSEQDWDPIRYASDAGFVAALGEPLIALLSPAPHERVLDLGCGEGALTMRLAEHSSRVVGVDASPAQVAAARARGLEAHVMDGEALTFERAFDAVFSNATLHWLKRPERAIAGIARALVPGGRLVAEFGGDGNVATIRRALHAGLARRGIPAEEHDPWYFPTAQAYRALLEAGGFVVDSIALFERPTTLPGDVRPWLMLFAQRFLHALPDAERAGYLDEVCAELEPSMRRGDGSYVADYVRLRVSARRVGQS